MLERIDAVFSAFSTLVWSNVLWLLLAAGAFLFLFSRALPYRHFGHAVALLTGRFDARDDPGELTHFEALSAALSGTLGLGNIAGVAVAIAAGGPGAVFWMWLTALLGVGTKFFTCTLAVMYRGENSMGVLQGGPMYVIREGLPRRWYPLAVFFCVAALFGSLPVFQVNQLVQIVRDVVAVPAGWTTADAHFGFDLIAGAVVALLVGGVIFGGVSRVGYAAARIVPSMVVLYLLVAGAVLVANAGAIPATVAGIVTDAFSLDAAGGGLLGSLLIGVRQGAFSNEAGIGTEALAHGAARTKVPAREGLVAMIGPVVDTLVVCTTTALVILVTGVAESGDENGVTLTARALEAGIGSAGPWILVLLVALFSISTMFTFWYYGAKCLGFLIGAERQGGYRWFYVALILLGAVVSVEGAVGLITGMYGLMAIPTVISTLLLAPKVLAHARDYLDGDAVS
ncbi:MAG: amino acid carrier protein [Pseudomonadales bacterium]|jgi:AGCS family alanine or glycine:cation symporter|nr:amino acid carrier protein [Pseudomonadales bacterium]